MLGEEQQQPSGETKHVNGILRGRTVIFSNEPRTNYILPIIMVIAIKQHAWTAKFREQEQQEPSAQEKLQQ
jgi:hypothetical protein